MRKAATVLFVLISLVYTFSCESDKKPEALLITGGHAFDTASFFDFFYSIEMIELDTISQPGANEYLATEEGKNHDIYIFYDMWKEISEDQKQAYLDLTKEGKSLLFLHHSLVSYQEWDTFKHIVGGRYRHPSSTSDSSLHSNYAHDLDLIVNIEDPNHPITDGMDRFIINDEGYGNLELINSIDTLLTTSHPNSHPVIGWTNHYGQSDIVYLIFGHDKKAYQDPDFRVIIENSIKWFTRE